MLIGSLPRSSCVAGDRSSVPAVISDLHPPGLDADRKNGDRLIRRRRKRLAGLDRKARPVTRANNRIAAQRSAGQSAAIVGADVLYCVVLTVKINDGDQGSFYLKAACLIGRKFGDRRNIGPVRHRPAASEHTELQPGRFRHVFLRPRRLPDQFDVRVRNAGNGIDLVFDSCRKSLRDRTPRRGQCHLNMHVSR